MGGFHQLRKNTKRSAAQYALSEKHDIHFITNYKQTNQMPSLIHICIYLSSLNHLLYGIFTSLSLCWASKCAEIPFSEVLSRNLFRFYTLLLHCKVTLLDNRKGTHPIFLSWLFILISNGEKRCLLWSVITLLLQIWVYNRYIGQRRIGKSSWKVIRALFASSDMYSKFYLLLEISLEN